MSAGVPAASCVIWRIVDGKPGHENQTLGLVRALADELPVDIIDLDALALPQAIGAGLLGLPQIGPTDRQPDLIICAGHKTHATALAVRHRHGGRIVLLMKPSLPLSWFDLCLIPEHDAIEAANAITTRGALNAVSATSEKDPKQGLILLGGPSRHAPWDGAGVCRQVEAIVSRDPRQWRLASSRRTPEETLQQIAQRGMGRLKIYRWQTVPDNWLRERLAVASTIWVSEDSVSMIYEALSSGASCGLLKLSNVKPTRVMAGVAQLVADGSVVYADGWLAGTKLQKPTEPLNEAARCARLIRSRWFADSGSKTSSNAASPGKTT